MEKRVLTTYYRRPTWWMLGWLGSFGGKGGDFCQESLGGEGMGSRERRYGFGEKF